MNLQDKVNLETLTYKILNSHKTFTSSDFISAYNIVYGTCTKVTPTFEILGKDVYKILDLCLLTHSRHLTSPASLKLFVSQTQNYLHSIELLKKVYSYLERFYISVNIEKREPSICSIEGMAYSYYYFNYIEKSEENIQSYITFELEMCRPNSKNFDFFYLRHALKYYKKVLIHADEEKKWEAFMLEYYSQYKSWINLDSSIEKVLKRVYIEIYIASKIFDITNNSIYKELASGVWKRAAEIIRFIINKARNFEKFKAYAKIVYFLDETYAYELFKEYLSFVGEEIRGTKNVIETYVKVREQIYTNLYEKTEYLVIRIKQLIKEYINATKLDYTAELIEKISMGFVNCSETSMLALIELINVSDHKDYILGQLSTKFQRYLLKYNTGHYSSKFAQLVEEEIEISSINKIKMSHNNFSKTITQSYGLSTQTDELKLNLNLLTYGFWNLEVPTHKLCKQLERIKDSIIQPLKIRNSRSNIMCCYFVSPVVFELSGMNFRMSTDKVSVLLDIEQENSNDYINEEILSYLVANVFSKLDVEMAVFTHHDDKKPENDTSVLQLERCVTKEQEDTAMRSLDAGALDIIQNLTFLINNRFVLLQNNTLVVNQCLEEETFKHVEQITVEDLVCYDLFDVKYDTVNEKGVVSKDQIDKKNVIEARLMVLLKKKKSIKRDDIKKHVEFHAEDIDEAVDRLEEKGYLNTENETVFYVP